ncbi:uncharacterized protein CYBJADRAFT_17364 [Cyberlindnera jadinii NRRL Y-1542]|uniref:Uncharacterized protein n=1 Tax=Cyberlindnera jadinii (strain ATCC 18201 / CBS 1600 / BCRC 20928 / JCM 3617 / NBRC 0987 / NRRL Y-1542) TaxID=983966 RepID=A0A1E4RZ98_CYBJN|nr:hypothetical protein CYBJADRAFT_17364 [Cyberlindnera jadinii NRRL Y-1542]ODV72569.1 hypothetical protein CYBJADRAFT_17364 [Cyberlindnera jadinii NRRL Y-1542]
MRCVYILVAVPPANHVRCNLPRHGSHSYKPTLLRTQGSDTPTSSAHSQSPRNQSIPPPPPQGTSAYQPSPAAARSQSFGGSGPN